MIINNMSNSDRDEFNKINNKDYQKLVKAVKEEQEYINGYFEVEG